MKKSTKAKAVFYGCFIIVIILFMLPSVVLATDNYYQQNNEWQYTIYHQVILENPYSEKVENLEIKVPLMLNNSLAYQSFLGEQFSPIPKEIRADKFGNREAVYKIPLLNPGEKIILEQRYAISSFSVKYNFNTRSFSLPYEDIPDERYLQPSLGIESTHEEIISYARQIAGTENNPYSLARKVFGDVNLFLTYNIDGNGNQTALETLRKGSGLCGDYSRLYVAILRSLGIPARVQTGYLYLPKEHAESPYTNLAEGKINLSYMAHAWPEFYLPELGWVLADPTFTYEAELSGSMSKIVDWDYFASIPSTRRYLAFRELSLNADNVSYSPGKYDISVDTYLRVGNRTLPFGDIENHYSKDDVMNLYNQGLIEGIGNGVYGVNDNLTRAQMATILKRMNIIDEKYQTKTFKVFSDVSPTHWAYESIGNIAKSGLMVGFSDGLFHPDAILSRGEIAVILVRAFKLEMGTGKANFKDLDVSGWGYAKDSINILASLGYAQGMGENMYRPEKSVTRGEMAVLLNRILKGTEANVAVDEAVN